VDFYRSTLEITVKQSDEFTDVNCNAGSIAATLFCAVQQAMYLKELKSDLQVGVATVLCDFAENYSFILQDEA
jgi:hypothetical protein